MNDFKLNHMKPQTKIVYEITYDERSQKLTIVNPQTKKQINVSSALTYDPSHPAYKLAVMAMRKQHKNNSTKQTSKRYSPEKMISGWRKEGVSFFDEDGDGNVTTIDSARWKRDYVQRGKESILAGVMHDMEDGKDTRLNFDKKYVVPEVLKFASDAVARGRKIIHLQEKGEVGLPEQVLISNALKKQFGSKVSIDTWDGKDTNIFSPDSPVFSQLSKMTGHDEKKVRAAMYFFGHDENPEVMNKLVPQYIDADTIPWLQKHGIKNPLRPDQNTMGQAYKANFPSDFNRPSNEMSDITDAYNQFREMNMLRKKKEYEKKGYAVVVTPGASHAYSLKNAFT